MFFERRSNVLYLNSLNFASCIGEGPENESKKNDQYH